MENENNITSGKKYKGMPSFNPHGRPKGSTNKVSTKAIREQIGKFINENAFPDLFKNFEKMSDRNKIELVTKLLPYFTPTLSATKNENIDGDKSSISFKITYDEPILNDNIEDIEFKEDDENIDF